MFEHTVGGGQGRDEKGEETGYAPEQGGFFFTFGDEGRGGEGVLVSCMVVLVVVSRGCWGEVVTRGVAVYMPVSDADALCMYS